MRATFAFLKCLVATTCLLTAAGPAQADLMRFLPGDVLEIRFEMPSAIPPIAAGPADLLNVMISNTSQLFIEAPVVEHTASLYDGGHLLGTITSSCGGDRTGWANLGAGT